MKKVFFLAIAFFSLVSIITIVGLTGVPIPKKISSHNCSATYLHYLIPNFLCQYLTAGHCKSTNFNKQNSEMQIARCLCDEYENTKDSNIGNDIADLCKDDNGCLYRIETIKSAEINYEFLNPEDISRLVENYANDPFFLCSNKEGIFSYSIIE